MKLNAKTWFVIIAIIALLVGSIWDLHWYFSGFSATPLDVLTYWFIIAYYIYAFIFLIFAVFKKYEPLIIVIPSLSLLQIGIAFAMGMVGISTTESYLVYAIPTYALVIPAFSLSIYYLIKRRT